MSNPQIPEGWPPHTELEPERILWRGVAQVFTVQHGAARRSIIEQGRRALWRLWFTTREYELEQRVSELEAGFRELLEQNRVDLKHWRQEDQSMSRGTHEAVVRTIDAMRRLSVAGANEQEDDSE